MEKRSSGILLPVSSLPSPYGIGTLGKPAYEFVDFLKKAGQSWWQVLPIGPTSYGDSPYQSFSCMAGNPYFIDLDELLGSGIRFLGRGSPVRGLRDRLPEPVPRAAPGGSERHGTGRGGLPPVSA